MYTLINPYPMLGTLLIHDIHHYPHFASALVYMYHTKKKKDRNNLCVNIDIMIDIIHI